MQMHMKNISALFSQVVIVIISIGAIAFLLWEPHIEGRNANATTFEVYFNDPFLAYVYAGSIAFFVALFRAFGLFGYVRKNRAFSQATVDALRAIRNCAFVILGFVPGALAFVMVNGDNDDRPAGISLCLFVTLMTSIVAIGAAVFARNLQRTLRQSEDSRVR